MISANSENEQATVITLTETELEGIYGGWGHGCERNPIPITIVTASASVAVTALIFAVVNASASVATTTADRVSSHR